MLKIEKIKEKIKNFDTDVTADENLSCWLYRITTNPSVNKHICSGLVCSECLRLSLLNLLEEYNGTLVIYNIAPHKTDTLWCTASAKWDKVNFNNLFNFVKWEDEEPWKIDSILSNCEVMQDE